jgi:hypothetical protein
MKFSIVHKEFFILRSRRRRRLEGWVAGTELTQGFLESKVEVRPQKNTQKTFRTFRKVPLHPA